MRFLLIDIDTLRADHLGCYGYPRHTSPHIDRIAKAGVRFDNYYCTDAPCLPSRAALITGMYGIHNGVVGHGGTAADRRLFGKYRDFRNLDDQFNLVNIFRRKGWYTASISTFPERHSAWWFNAGFNEMHNVGKGGLETAGEVLPVALDWLSRNADRKDWFLHLHLWDPHTPYRAPAEFGNPFADAPLPAWITQEVLAKHLKAVGPHSILDLGMYDDAESPAFPRQPGKATDMRGVRRIIDGYDCGVAYADSIVGRVLDQLESQGILEETAVVVTSDHGENLGELGIYSEHGTADHATCHIPLIVKWPGGRVGTDSGLHGNVDLCPTLADLLQVEPYPRWDGVSFAPALTKGLPSGREDLAISQMAHVCQRSVRFGKWLYIRTYHAGFHLFPKEMLFDLSADPHEQVNLAETEPEITAQGAARLFSWQDDMMASSDSVTDPLWIVLQEGGPYHAQIRSLPDYLKRLEATGRSEGAQKLREIYRVPLEDSFIPDAPPKLQEVRRFAVSELRKFNKKTAE